GGNECCRTRTCACASAVGVDGCGADSIARLERRARQTPRAHWRSIQHMKQVLPILAFAFGTVTMSHAASPMLVIHGGAGVVAKEVTPEREKAVRAALQRALES